MVSASKHVTAALALGLAMTALATPSFAQQMSASREKALRDCNNGEAGKMSQAPGATSSSTTTAPAWRNTASRNNAEHG